MSLKPSLVFQEIMSYIKGSAEALESEIGHLTLDQYLEVRKLLIRKCFAITSHVLIPNSLSSGLVTLLLAC